MSRALVTAALLHGQKAFDALANGGQAEACGVDFGKGYPLGVGGIVAGGNALQTGYATQEKSIGRVNHMTTEGIGVGKGKQKFIGHYFGCLLYTSPSPRD